MHGVAERAERGEERIIAVTRGLADLALSLETALTRNNVRTAQSISNFVAPLEDAVNALGNRMSSTSQRAAQEAPPPPAAAQFYDTPDGSAASDGASEPQLYSPVSQAQSLQQGGAEKSERLKFDFNALNARAIKNSQRLADELDESGAEDGDDDSSWVSKQGNSETDDPSVDQANAKADAKTVDNAKSVDKSKSLDDDDWASEYMVEDGAQNSAQAITADDLREPTLDDASPVTAAAPAAEDKPVVSEEDEMLLALKQAIRPDKP